MIGIAGYRSHRAGEVVIGVDTNGLELLKRHLAKGLRKLAGRVLLV